MAGSAKDWRFPSKWRMTKNFSTNTGSDFIYADPPYDVEFTNYSKEAFGWPEQVRTAEWLAKHKGPVILSNQATDRINALYEKLGYKLLFFKAPRRISCTGDRTPAKEVLATRNLP